MVEHADNIIKHQQQLQQNKNMSGEGDNDSENDEIEDLKHFNSKFKPFRDNLPTRKRQDSDRFSTYSASTTSSTIAPEVIKARVKGALEKRNAKGQARRRLA